MNTSIHIHETDMNNQRKNRNRPVWLKLMKQFEHPSTGSAVWQIITTLIPYLSLLVIMYLTIKADTPYWITFLISIPAAGLLVRIFIFFHDCCHGSFIASGMGMRILGNIFGILTFTPFADWRYTHGQHHSSSGNLDQRGLGDVWTMTMQEYIASTKWKRILYRFYRNPLVMFGLGPISLFFLSNRFSEKKVREKTGPNVHLTNIIIGLLILTASFTIGFFTYVKIQLPVLYFAGMGGIWLFYVQHQFDPGYWARDNEWGTVKAALEGSSFYKLPAILNWFSGNIGFHHIHHLLPRIPNYNLKKCLVAIPELQEVKPLTILRSLKSLNLHIWDETNNKLLSFRDMSRNLRAKARIGAAI